MKARIEGEIKVSDGNGNLIAMSFFDTPVQADGIGTLNDLCDASAIVINELVRSPECLAKVVQLVVNNALSEKKGLNLCGLGGGSRVPEASSCRTDPRRGGENGPEGNSPSEPPPCPPLHHIKT